MSDERKIGELTVRIDRTACIGSRNCVKVAPDLFVMDDEDIVTFASSADSVPAGTVIEACEVCPVEALRALAADGTQRVP